MTEGFIRAMFGAAEILGRELTEERVAGYWAVLGHYGSENLVQAIHASLRQSRFFPTPADLIAILEDEPADTKAAAAAAWAEILAGLANGKAQQMVDQDERIAAAVTAAGGLYNIRTGSDQEPQHFKRLAFIEAYRGATQKARRANLLKMGQQPALNPGEDHQP